MLHLIQIDLQTLNLKAKYEADPIAVMTTSGLVPDPGANPLLSGIFDLISKLFKIDEIDVDNAPSTSKLSLSGYKKVCVDKSQRNEYIPVSVNDLGSSCPSGAVTMDISPSSSVQFKPTSYKYLSYWIKDIGISDTNYIALTGAKLEEKVDAYNDKIDCLVACGNSCESDYNICYNGCSGCVTETYTGTCSGSRLTYDSNGVQTGTESYDYDCDKTRLDCSARDACRASCESDRISCRNDCNLNCS